MPLLGVNDRQRLLNMCKTLVYINNTKEKIDIFEIG